MLAAVDAPNTDGLRRAALIRKAAGHERPATATASDLPLDLCLLRNAARPRTVRPAVVRRQREALRGDLDRLDLEGFSAVYVLRTEDEIEQVVVQTEKGLVLPVPKPG